MINKSDCQKSHSQSLASRVKKIWLKNDKLTAKPLCKILGIPYKKHGDYVAHIRTRLKYDHKNSQGSKWLSSHHWHGWIYAPKNLNRDIAVSKGWIQTKARNRYLLWIDRLGRLEWFETGRIKVFVKKPSTDGNKFQLLANAFAWTELFVDMNGFFNWINTLRMKGSHYALELGFKVPYRRFSHFVESNGVEIVFGDKTHPTSLEMKVSFPHWAERLELANKILLNRLDLNDRVIAQNTEQILKFNDLFGEKRLKKQLDYLR